MSNGALIRLWPEDDPVMTFVMIGYHVL
jgi:hypothetical protein